MGEQDLVVAVVLLENKMEYLHTTGHYHFAFL